MNTAVRWSLDLVRELTRKELKVWYRNSFLGYVWSVASPAAQALVYFFALKVIVRIAVEDYGLFLIAGLFTWQWFANSLAVCTSVFLNNASATLHVPRSIWSDWSTSLSKEALE